MGPGDPAVWRRTASALGEWQVGSEPVRLEVPLPQSLWARATPVIQNAGTLDPAGRLGAGPGHPGPGHRGVPGGRPGPVRPPGRGVRRVRRRPALQADSWRTWGCSTRTSSCTTRTWTYPGGCGGGGGRSCTCRARWSATSTPPAAWSGRRCLSINVERNRLLMLAKNAPARLALSEHAGTRPRRPPTGARLARCIARRSPDWTLVARRGGIQIRVLASLLGQLPRTLAKRRTSAAGTGSRPPRW